MLLSKNPKANMKIYIPLILLLSLIVILVIFIHSFAVNNYKESTNTGVISGRNVHQSIYGKNTQEVFKKVKENFLKLEDTLSYDIDGSDIEKINSGAGTKWTRVHSKTMDILNKVKDISKNTNGFFDITSLPLFNIWSLDGNQGSRPTNEEIIQTLAHVDYNLININQNLERVKLDSESSLISLKNLLSAILCQSAIDVYSETSINYGIVSVGSITGVCGQKPDQKFWKISLKDPFDNDITIGNIKIKDGYVCTFGNSSDKILLDGKKVNKIINPKNGMIPDTDIAAATVVYSDALISSALSKVCCLVDMETSLKILNYYGAEAIFVENSKNIYITKNIYNNFSTVKDDYLIHEISFQ